MKYFEEYNSNSYAGSGNQLYFEMDENEVRKGRILYKISVGGEYNYSLLFSNIIDSTYADGTVSQKNLICDNWTIHGAKIGKCKYVNNEKELAELTMECEGADIEVFDFTDITFGGKSSKEIVGGEFFCSDPVKISFRKGEYLCLEIIFSGTKIPYHEESLLPVFVEENGVWKYSKFMPFAGMIGCDRKVKSKVAYFGDSITQGIGTKPNSYLHWNALLSEKLGNEYSYWNLGIGYGRANDAASDGAWLYKAKQNDIIFICFGANDILRGFSEKQIKADLLYIVESLKNLGKKVVLQTIPPFNYNEETTKKWNEVNKYILTELKEKVDLVFDNTQYLGKKEKPQDAIYGGHPNEEGCKLWADTLFEKIKFFFCI